MVIPSIKTLKMAHIKKKKKNPEKKKLVKLELHLSLPKQFGPEAVR